MAAMNAANGIKCPIMNGMSAVPCRTSRRKIMTPIMATTITVTILTTSQSAPTPLPTAVSLTGVDKTTKKTMETMETTTETTPEEAGMFSKHMHGAHSRVLWVKQPQV